MSMRKKAAESKKPDVVAMDGEMKPTKQQLARKETTTDDGSKKKRGGVGATTEVENLAPAIKKVSAAISTAPTTTPTSARMPAGYKAPEIVVDARYMPISMQGPTVKSEAEADDEPAAGGKKIACKRPPSTAAKYDDKRSPFSKYTNSKKQTPASPRSGSKRRTPQSPPMSVDREGGGGGDLDPYVKVPILDGHDIEAEAELNPNKSGKGDKIPWKKWVLKLGLGCIVAFIFFAVLIPCLIFLVPKRDSTTTRAPFATSTTIKINTTTMLPRM